MKKPMFSIKDNLVGFNKPFIGESERHAIREFRTLVGKLDRDQDETVFDLGLYYVGSFNFDTGEVERVDPQVVLLATQCLTMCPKEYGDDENA